MSRARTVAKEFSGTREAWCLALVDFFSQELATGDDPITMQGDRTIKISIAPISRADTLGICHASTSSPEKNINHIVVSPVQAQPIELAHTVLHEMLHAFDNCNSRHKGRWKRWASRFGIQSKGHSRNTRGQVLLERAIEFVGIPVEHAGQVMIKNKKAPAIIKFVCPTCDNFAYISAKVVLANEFHIKCETDNVRMEKVA